MRTLHIDIETYSSIDLLSCGVYKYVESSDFEILLFAYSYDEGPVSVIDITQYGEIPVKLKEAILDINILKVAHNTTFERVCLSKSLGIQLSPENWICTMVMATVLGLPASLAKVATALKLNEQKDSAGKNLINYFCKPCKPTKANSGRTRNLPEHDPEKWNLFMKYNKQDVKTEMAIFAKLNKFPILESEYQLWCLDQKINDRGLRIDIGLVDEIMKFANMNSLKMQEDCERITGGINVKSVAQLKTWMSEQENRSITSLTKASVSELLADKTIKPQTRRILEIRQQTGKTSISKYDAIKRATCDDGYLRGTLQFYGANRTGRWAGRIFQPQNLPRNTFDDFAGARSMIQDGDIDMVDMFYDSYNNVFSTLIRTMVIPSTLCKFAVADYSAIEARVTAWFCDEQWRLDVFAKDGKIYEASASQMFHVPIEEITKGSDLRKKGKVAELALGYGGGVSALERMGGAAMGLSENEMEEIKTKWRLASPNIKNMWYKVMRAAESAVTEHKRAEVSHGMYYWYNSGILFAHLPSGRDLAYARPRIIKGQYGTELEYDGYSSEKDEEGSLKYAGGWGRQHAWGGKLFENLIQAIARDCLGEAMMKIDKREPYQIVMHVHDEVIVEVPQDSAQQDLKRIEDIMAEPIKWASGLNLTADGFVCDYYKKD